MRDCFLTYEFGQLNGGKVDEVVALPLYADRCKVGEIVMGRRGNEMLSPFSAPYGGVQFEPNINDVQASQAADFFATYLENNVLRCRIVFPAPVADDDFTRLNKVFKSRLLELGFELLFSDVNYHIELNRPDFAADVLRRHSRGCKAGYVFGVVKPGDEEFASVCDAIERNHRALGYNVAMKVDDYIATSRLVDMFGCYVKNNSSDIIAGAVCYCTREGVVQLISWGDLPATRRGVAAMPFMAMELVRYLQSTRLETAVLDLGPASSRGIANRGLMHFKESLGGRPTLKDAIALGWR